MPVLILRRSADAANTFSTTFSGTNESPLSEGGNWARAANSWQSMRVQNGVAKPTAFNESTTDDNYSLCQVVAPTDAEVIATVFIANGANAEFELLLRMSDSAGNPGTAAGYEYLYNSDSSVQLVRWNGTLGSFTPFDTFLNSSRPTLLNGDQLRATVIGNQVSGYHRRPPTSTWTLIAQGTDNTFSTGKCGIGNFVHQANAALDDIGFTDFSVAPA
jgi:hypothetical protein